MKISDHQPFLFGHEGYWSKIAVADVHVVMADVIYRPEDKLTTCIVSDTISFAGMLRGPEKAPAIWEMRLFKAKKLRASVEQIFMSKSMPYRERLEPLLPLLTEDRPYLELWAAMAGLVMDAAGIQTELVYSLNTPSGTTPLTRNLNRLALLELPSEGSEYVCGPAIQHYAKRSDQCPMPLLLHQLQDPSPVSFVRRIVTELAPTLPIPQLLERSL